MTVNELKRLLQIVENNGLGDVEVYFTAGWDPRGNEELFAIEDVSIDQYGVIVLDGYSMEDECEFTSELDAESRQNVEVHFNNEEE